VAAEAVAAAIARTGIQTGPTPHHRIAAIGADDPARAQKLTRHANAVALETGNRCAPHHAHAGLGGALRHQFVQGGAADAESHALREGSFHRQIPVTKADAAKGPRAGLVERDAKRARGGNAIRHDALAAGLVDGRLRTIGHGDVEAAVARGDGRGQPRRAAADDEDIGGLS